MPDQPPDAGLAVSVVVPTRGRPDLLPLALESIRTQDLPGPVETIVVFDGTEADPSYASDDPHRPVRVTRNARRKGPAGGRNTGILLASGRYVAFLDDDDTWRADKLTRQLRAMQDSGRRAAVSTIAVRQGNEVSDRPFARGSLSFGDLLRSRTQEAHQSTVVVERRYLLNEVGLFDEDVPGSYGEDFDWLLRSAALEPLVVVPLPLAEVRWHDSSWFFDRWGLIVEALDYLIAKHPALLTDARGAAVLTARLAYSHAALGHRRASLRMLRTTLRKHPGELRWVLVLPVLVSPRAALPLLRLVRATTGRSI